MFAKQFLETKPWEARSQRHQNRSVVLHWAPATSYLLNTTGQDQRKRKHCILSPDWRSLASDGHSLFLTGIEVMLDHLKCRYAGHWSIHHHGSGEEERETYPHMEWGAWAALGNQPSVSRGKAVGFGSLSVAAGETVKCGKVVTWWLISPKVWHSSGTVSLLPGSL